MTIPICPFKFIMFDSCEHLIVFLEEEDYDSVEFINYNNSPNGKGIELILTLKDNSQIILTNNSLAFVNLKFSGKKIYQSNIKLYTTEHFNLIQSKIECFSDEFNIIINFQSLFPISNIREGIIDPKRHGKDSLPMLYSSQNTVGASCKIKINGKNYKVKLSNDEILKKYKGLCAYYSKDFYMGIFKPFDLNIKIKNILSERVTYLDIKNNVEYAYINLMKDNICRIEVEQYIENYVCEYKYSDDFEYLYIENVKVLFDKKEILRVTFNPYIPVFNKEYNSKKIYKGDMKIYIADNRGKFNCNYEVEFNNQNKKDDDLIKSEAFFKITYSNQKWKEKERTIFLQTEQLWDRKIDIIKSYKAKLTRVEVK